MHFQFPLDSGNENFVFVEKSASTPDDKTIQNNPEKSSMNSSMSILVVYGINCNKTGIPAEILISDQDVV